MPYSDPAHSIITAGRGVVGIADLDDLPVVWK